MISQPLTVIQRRPAEQRRTGRRKKQARLAQVHAHLVFGRRPAFATQMSPPRCVMTGEPAICRPAAAQINAHNAKGKHRHLRLLDYAIAQRDYASWEDLAIVGNGFDRSMEIECGDWVIFGVLFCAMQP